MSESNTKSDVFNRLNSIRFLLPLIALAPAPAFASGGLSTFTSMVTKFTTFITGGFGIALLTLVIMVAGLMAFANKLDVSWVVRIVIGSALIFGASAIANLLLT